MSQRIQEWADRCAARQMDPEFQRNAAKLAEEMRESEQRSVELQRAAALRRAEIPETFWPHLDSPRPTAALDAVQRFLAAPPALAFMALAGPVGRGKSFALAWAVYRAGGVFADSTELVTAGSFDGVFWNELERARVLALDELGSEHANPAYEATLFALLNRRYLAGRKTLLATNLDAAGFRKRYLDSSMERLLDRFSTAGEWVALPGESMRRHWADGSDP